RRLAADPAHVWVAVAGRGSGREDLVQAGLVLGTELHLGRGRILLEVAAALGAGYRHDVVALGLYPRQGQLTGGDALVVGHGPDGLDQLKVAVEVLALEARLRTPEVALLEVVRALDLAREEAPTERAVGHDPDPQVACDRDDFGLEVA